MVSRICVSVPLLVALLVITACTNAPTAPGERGADSAPRVQKRIAAVVMSDIRAIIEPLSEIGNSEGGGHVLDLVHAGLSITDGAGQLRPRLAEAVPSLENGLWKLLQDGRMETTWKLRADARWQDGATFTTDDLVFTEALHRDASLAVVRSPSFALVESVQATDPSTLVVRWKSPFIEADRLFNQPLPLPRHILEAPYEAGKLASDSYWTDGFVGMGPYRISELVLGSHLLLEANDQYVLGRPRVDTIEIKFIPDVNTLMANALAGTVDLTLGRGISLDQAIEVRERWRGGQVGIAFSSWLALYPQFLNPSPAVIADVRFRKALMYAMNRQEMVDTIMSGLVPVANTFINSGLPEFKAIEGRIVRYDYDPQRAVRMIEDLGYSRGPDGGLRDATQQRLAIELRSRGRDYQLKALLSVADYWQRAGIAAELVQTTQSQDADRVYRANYPTFDLAQQPTDYTVAAVTRYHGGKSPLPENNYVGTNRTRYRNPEWDALLDRWSVTIPKNERTQVLGQIAAHLSDQLNIMGLFYSTEPTLIANQVKNITPNAKELETTTAWNAHEWDVGL